jgi:ankyrin repeat protein
MRYLLDHGADVDAQSSTGHPTPLHLASYLEGSRLHSYCSTVV